MLVSSNILPLSSVQGQQLLNNLPNSYNRNMINYFQPQKQSGLSGPASLALLITSFNAIAYRIRLSEYRYNSPEFQSLLQRLHSGEFLQTTANDIMSIKSVKKYLKVNSINIQKDGLTLQELRKVAHLLMFGVDTSYVDNQHLSKEKRAELNKIIQGSGDILKFKNLQDFQSRLYDFFNRMRPAGIIVNYNRSVIGYNDQLSHFSPVAAYDKASKRVLIMDVDGQPVWVKSEVLYKAMGTIDTKSGLPCGMVHVYELL